MDMYRDSNHSPIKPLTWSTNFSPQDALTYFIQCNCDIDKILPIQLTPCDGIYFIKQIDDIISSNLDDSHISKLLNAVGPPKFVKRLVKVISSIDETDYAKIDQISFSIVRVLDALYVRKSHLSSRILSVLTAVDILLARGINHIPLSEEEQREQLYQYRDELENLRKTINNFSIKRYAKRFRHENDKRKPPEDFRKIQILPTTEDIFISGDGKPFLRRNIARGSYADLDHYLDVQFRLLREDCISQLRNGILEYIQKKENPDTNSCKIQEARLYNIARIVDSEISLQGKVYTVQLDRNKAKHIQWKRTNRLNYGTLICLSPDDFKTLFFGVVADSDRDVLIQSHKFKVQISNERGIQVPVTGNVRIIESTAYFENYQYSLRYLQTVESGKLPFERYIVRCQTDVKPPAYLLKRRNIKFDFYPNIIDTNIYEYMEKSERHLFKYDILKNEWPTAEQLKLDDSQYQAFKSALVQEFSIIQGPPGTGKTYLCLQIAKALLRNRFLWNKDHDYAMAENHPMVVVCLTNHALDRFMEGIFKFLTTNRMPIEKCGIVRLGSRCQNAQIDKFSIRNLRKMHHKSMDTFRYKKKIKETYRRILQAKYCLQESYHSIVSTEEFSSGLGIDTPFSNHHEMHCWLGVSEKCWMTRIRKYLSETKTDQSNKDDKKCGKKSSNRFEMAQEMSFTEKQFDIDDFEIKKVENIQLGLNLHKQMKNSKRRYSRKLPKSANSCLLNILSETIELINHETSMSNAKASEISGNKDDIWKFPNYARWNLYRFWLKKWRKNKQEELSRLENEFYKTLNEYETNRKEIDTDILRKSVVIAMTITGASKNQDIMTHVGPRIIIVEEAAETLEAQIISVLSSSCQQLILIGDHKQLEPKPAVFELAQKYKMSLSLFERMIRNGLPFNSLEYQHRMRPEISELVRPIYKTLHDAPEVLSYPDVGVVMQNIYFFNHSCEETFIEDSRSYSNLYEAKFVKGLCNYLLETGYESSQITVLTPYSLQMFAIREIMPRFEYDELRITCLDRFQGDENDIIILSLVRSNKEGKIGFLEKENRACVALSRAKIGLFVVGNIDQLCRFSRNGIWRRTVGLLTESCVGNTLPLQNTCPNHDEIDSLIRSPEDFEILQMETGCNRQCEELLHCGHLCQMSCHLMGSQRDEHLCMKQCLKMCTNGHCCLKPCHGLSPCSCEELVKTQMSCGHYVTVICYMNEENEENLSNRAICTSLCRNTCDNGHACTKTCHYPKACACTVTTEKELICGHNAMVKCSEDPTLHTCLKITEKELPCGHKAMIKCSDDPVLHKCLQSTEKELPCRHKTVVKCSTDVIGMICFENVSKTIENCGHSADIPCFKNPSEYKCTVSVTRKLKCGHTVEMDCYVDTEEYECQSMVLENFQCGHESYITCCMRGKEHKCRALVAEAWGSCSHLYTRECCDKNYSDMNVCEEPVMMRRSQCNHYFKVPCNTLMIANSYPKSERDEFIEELESTFEPCKEEFRIEFPCKHDFQSVKCSEIRSAACLQICGRVCVNNHRCEAVCHYPEKCECKVLVSKQVPGCGHMQNIPCSQSPKTVRCEKMVKKALGCSHSLHLPCHCVPYEQECEEKAVYELNCGHKITSTCSQILEMKSSQSELPKCQELVNVQHPWNRYKITVPCEEKNGLLKLLYQQDVIKWFSSELYYIWDCGHTTRNHTYKSRESVCSSKCSKKLACGHLCKENCKNCYSGEIHVQCNSSCGTELICGHCCQSERCGSCELCKMDCEHMCVHMKCSLKCSFPCQRCVESCPWSCPHQKCSKLCGEACDRPRCNILCQKVLPCGHKCSGFCGDPCPNLCRFCNVEELNTITTHDVNNVVFVQLMECKHIFDSSILDEKLDQQWSCLQTLCCPKCKSVIKHHPRYTNILNLLFQFREKAKLQLLYMSQKSNTRRVPFSTQNFSEYRTFFKEFGMYLFQNEERLKNTNRKVFQIIDNLHEGLSQFFETKSSFVPKVQQCIDIYHALLKMKVFWQCGISVQGNLTDDISFTFDVTGMSTDKTAEGNFDSTDDITFTFDETDMSTDKTAEENFDSGDEEKINELRDRVSTLISTYPVDTDLLFKVSSELQQPLHLCEAERNQPNNPLSKLRDFPKIPYILDPHAIHWKKCNKDHIFCTVIDNETCHLCCDVTFESELETFKKEGIVAKDENEIRHGIINVPTALQEQVNRSSGQQPFDYEEEFPSLQIIKEQGREQFLEYDKEGHMIAFDHDQGAEKSNGDTDIKDVHGSNSVWERGSQKLLSKKKFDRKYLALRKLRGAAEDPQTGDKFALNTSDNHEERVSPSCNGVLWNPTNDHPTKLNASITFDEFPPLTRVCSVDAGKNNAANETYVQDKGVSAENIKDHKRELKSLGEITGNNVLADGMKGLETQNIWNTQGTLALIDALKKRSIRLGYHSNENIKSSDLGEQNTDIGMGNRSLSWGVKGNPSRSNLERVKQPGVHCYGHGPSQLGSNKMRPTNSRISNLATNARSSSCDRFRIVSKELNDFGRVHSTENIATFDKGAGIRHSREYQLFGGIRPTDAGKNVVGMRSRSGSDGKLRRCTNNSKDKGEAGHQWLKRRHILPKDILAAEPNKTYLSMNIGTSSCESIAEIWKGQDSSGRAYSAENIRCEAEKMKERSKSVTYDAIGDKAGSTGDAKQEVQNWIKVEKRVKNRDMKKPRGNTYSGSSARESPKTHISNEIKQRQCTRAQNNGKHYKVDSKSSEGSDTKDETNCSSELRAFLGVPIEETWDSSEK